MAGAPVPEEPERPLPGEGPLLTALLTEHFVLQTARSITVAESGSRASLYLMTLSSSLVAYGFLAGTSHQGAFLAVVFPILVVLGLTSYVRLVDTSLEDVLALAGIQRIRRYYAGLSVDAPAYFPLPTTRTAPNELLDTGRRASWRGVFYTTSSSVGLVNAVVTGTAVYVLLSDAGPATGWAVAASVAAALVVEAAQVAYQELRYRSVTAAVLRAG